MVQDFGELFPLTLTTGASQHLAVHASAELSPWAPTTAAVIAGWESRFLSPAATSQPLAALSGLLPLTADCLVEFTEEPSLSSPSDTLPECSPAQAVLYITRTSWVISSGSLEFWDCFSGPLQQFSLLGVLSLGGPTVGERWKQRTRKLGSWPPTSSTRAEARHFDLFSIKPIKTTNCSYHLH